MDLCFDLQMIAVKYLIDYRFYKLHLMGEICNHSEAIKQVMHLTARVAEERMKDRAQQIEDFSFK